MNSNESTHDLLFQSVVEHEPDANLVYADYLEGLGDGYRAEFWREGLLPTEVMPCDIVREVGYRWYLVHLPHNTKDSVLPVELSFYLTTDHSLPSVFVDYDTLEIAYIDAADAWYLARVSGWSPNE